VTDSTPRNLIVIPVMAGSIDALKELLSSLPESIAVPILVPVRGGVEALQVTRQQMDGIDGRDIVVLESGRAPVQDGSVVLLPSNQSVEISDGEVGILGAPDTVGNRPMAEAVGSAARALGEHTVGVIVDSMATGAPDDVYEIHAHGGTVIVEGLLGHEGLPTAIPPSKVDVVAPRSEIGAALSNLLGNGSLPSERSTSEALRALLDDLRDRFGINFSSYKQPTIVRRIQRRMADTGQTTLAAYHTYVESHPEEYQRLVSSFLIKVTSFFRDPELYDYLQRHIIPDLIAYARAHDGELRVWSAGCATGEEAYSLAILLSEALGRDSDSVRVRVFATDLDGAAIEFARRGVYPEAALTDLPPELVTRYFVQIDGEYQVTKRIRSMCIFGQHDLAERAPFPRIDLLVSRNVLIYFTSELQRRVLQLFAFSLRDNGYLVLGKSETTTPLPENFVADNVRLKVYRRRGERMLIPPARLREAQVPEVPVRHQPRRSQVLQTGGAQGGNQSRARERTDGALMHLPVGVIHVNEQYDIQFINNAARRLLHIHGNALGEDLVHLAGDLPAREFRRAIDTAFSDGRSTTIEDVPVTGPSTGQSQYLRVSVAPQAENHFETVVQVLVEDVTGSVQRSQSLQQELQREREEVAALREQVQRLSETNTSLLGANQELTVTNMELRAANEEYLVGNEELQAAAEEVETLNEELQATNEELETLNEELQATVEELNATNEDLQSRSVELEELAVSLQSQRIEIDMERARLEAVLSSLADAVMVVDHSGKVKLTNAAFGAMFPGSLQPLDASGEPIPTGQTPWEAAARGEPSELEFMQPGPDGTQRWFEARGRPIDGALGDPGGVVVIRDISLSRSRDEQ
jgi:two-component system CheB/CheR fusion protein